MKILTAGQMQEIDRLTTTEYGIPSIVLMENAGAGVVRFIAERYGPLDRRKIVIVCGRGNNGGDGLVVARLLREQGLNPRVLLVANASALQGDAAVNYGRLKNTGLVELVPDIAAWKHALSSLTDASLIIDAVLGTGLSKPLQGFLLEVVRDLNGLAGATRVAVDLPSGVAADSGDLIGECVHADASVTFTAPKHAHVFPPACAEVGEWRVHSIGTPREAVENDPELFLSLTCREDLAWLTLPRKMDSHKGTYGHVLLLSGSVGKTGAAALAAKAALRSGVGLVTIATPASALPVVAGLGMEYMTTPLSETADGTVSLEALDGGRLDRLVEGKSVLAMGPGLGSNPETAELVREVAQRYSLPLVIDADGLNAFSGKVNQLGAPGRVRVLTPHPGEMARLTGMTTAEIQKHRVEAARDFAMKYKLHMVLKGSRTLVASPDGEVAVNPTGNPGMATGGTGDCLTGIVAGLLAQHPSRGVAEVLRAAVYIHGLAGDLAAWTKGETALIAGDLIEAIPRALLSLKKG
ncbi:MAG: NAD(P)H-hydrate dehydratase [Terriglobia bacterium]